MDALADHYKKSNWNLGREMSNFLTFLLFLTSRLRASLGLEGKDIRKPENVKFLEEKGEGLSGSRKWRHSQTFTEIN